MKPPFASSILGPFSAGLLFLLNSWTQAAPVATPQTKALPAAANHLVDFSKEIKPLFEESCIKCHAKGKAKGGFSLENRVAFLKGGDNGPTATEGKSAESYLVELVAGTGPDEMMPKKGTKWTPEQVGLLRAWIDQGMPWEANVTFARPAPLNLYPHPALVPDGPAPHPLDRLLEAYFATRNIPAPSPVDDRLFIRRVSLDTVGLLPTEAQIHAFESDPLPDKRERLVRSLLSESQPYADHWMTFWNDLLRNDYAGTGFIDGGRKQITRWLYSALLNNRPYDQLVRELINPTSLSEGFTAGIIWRGTVNASMTPPMQAAQNISQALIGVNIKCASCHDSFINDWSLADAYGLAAVYSEQSMELVHCDKPTGKHASPAFLYPQLGKFDEKASKAEQLQRLAEIVTSKQNGRLPRTIVNRLWARLLGTGLVGSIDDMEKPAWSSEILDWLAEDLVAHHYDLKRTLEMILSSRAYQLPTVEAPETERTLVFRGPLTRRLTAEQFSDALSALDGTWARLPASLEIDFNALEPTTPIQMPSWIWTDEPVALGPQRREARTARNKIDAALKQLKAAHDALELAGDEGTAAYERARSATNQAATAVTAAEQLLKPLAHPPAATTPAPPGAILPASDLHRVVFRKTFQLSEAPAEAYATILASQDFEMQVNGKEARPIKRDGARRSRIILFNIKELLVAGENIIAIDVASHTDKAMNDAERVKYPASNTHLNAQSGLAFYLCCKSAEHKALQEVFTDETWRVRRNPEMPWDALDLADKNWAPATPLADGIAPIDEGPGLEPLTRRDFANRPVILGTQLAPAVSIIKQSTKIRASLLTTDPLQSALDRPNREQIITARASLPTTLQALELTNGKLLNSRLKATAARLAPEAANDPGRWVEKIYNQLLNRPPNAGERAIALELLNRPVEPAGVEDFLWALVNLPEFQLIN